MATYRMVYGDDALVVRQTLEDVELYREDGWTVFFRGNDSILRARDEHVQALEALEVTSVDEHAPAWLSEGGVR